jgi:hypothetical protein
MTHLIISSFVGINFGTIQFQVQKPTMLNHAGNGVREPSSFVPRVPFESLFPPPPASRFPQEQIDILQEIPFTIPIEGGEQLSFTLPYAYAKKLIARATAMGMTVSEYLEELISREEA